jgi:tRNA 2-thiouridine synthesizing protein A
MTVRRIGKWAVSVGELAWQGQCRKQAMSNQYVDCKGIRCPMPLVMISKAIKGMAAGETLAVEASDPAFEADLKAWARKTGNILVEFAGGDVQKAVIKKA